MAHHLFIKTFKSFGFGDNSGSLPSLTLTSFQSLYGLHFFQHFSILTILEYMSYGLLILQTLPELSQLPTICEQLLLKADLNTQLWFFLVDNDSHRRILRRVEASYTLLSLTGNNESKSQRKFSYTYKHINHLLSKYLLKSKHTHAKQFVQSVV